MVFLSHRKYAHGFKKGKSYCIVLNLQNELDKLMENFCKCFDTLSNTVDNLSSKPDLVESSLVVIKTVNDNLLNRITTLERRLHAQEQYSRRECLEIVGIPVAMDDKNLQILKIVIESKVTIPSSSLAAEENHLRLCVKSKN